MDKYEERSESYMSVPSRSQADAGLGDYTSRSEVLSENEAIGGRKFVLRNQWQHAMYFVAYTFSWGSFAAFRRSDGSLQEDEMPTWFHELIVYLFFGGPMLYVQLFIGQYTQKGCLVLGAMLPLAYGVGYALLLNTLLKCSINMYFCSCAMYYTFIAMINYPTPSWMICMDDINIPGKRCFSRDDIDKCPACYEESTEQCFDPNRDIFSASIFKDYVIFGAKTGEAQTFNAMPNIIQAVHLLITTILILCFAVRHLKDLDGSIRIWNVFAVVSIVITIAVIFLSHPSITFLSHLFEIRFSSLKNFKPWMIALKATAERLNITEAGHFLFGSYMPLTVSCTTRVTYLLTAHFIVLLLCNIQGLIMEDFLACSLNTEFEALNRFSDIEVTFSVYPTTLGIIAAAQLWASLYFIIIFSLTMHSIVLQIILIQETLNQEIFDPIYYMYTRVILIIVTSSIALVFTSPSGYLLATDLFLRRNIALFLIIFLTYLVLLLYGIEKLSDDIHFLVHSPPSKYLKWSWTMGGIASGCILVFEIAATENFHHMYMIISIFFTSISVPIGLTYKVFMAIKKRQLVTLLKSSDTWGPIDKEERMNRKLFNPRYETRFRRRLATCKHRCLLRSITLRKCLEKELTLLTNVLLEMEEKEENQQMRREYLSQLRRHREIMAVALNLDSRRDYIRENRDFAKQM